MSNLFLTVLQRRLKFENIMTEEYEKTHAYRGSITKIKKKCMPWVYFIAFQKEMNDQCLHVMINPGNAYRWVLSTPLKY